MTIAKFHLQIESERLAMNTYDTYFLMGVHTMPDGEVIYMDLLRDSNLENIRQIAQQRAFNDGCRVVEAL